LPQTLTLLGKKIFDYEWLPARRVKRGDAPKLIIVLHGMGDSLKAFRRFNHELELLNFNFLLLNAPRKYRGGGFSWYTLEPKHRPGIRDSRQRLIALLDHLEQKGWPLENIFVLGHSQGGLLACDLGLHYPKRLGGLICVSGYLAFFNKWKENLPKSAKKTPWLVTHGTKDEVLPIQKTRKQMQKLVDVGLPLDWRELEKDHDFDYESETKTIRDWIVDRASKQKKSDVFRKIVQNPMDRQQQLL
jgi:phospholipase/carboxylesterase